MTIKLALTILAPVALIVAAITVPAAISMATPQEPAQAVAATPAIPAPGPAPIVIEPVDEGAVKAIARHEHLRAYVLDVMNGWTHAVSSMPVADYDDVASDIATAVIAEPDDGQHCGLMPSVDGFRRCLWGVPSWDSDHAKATLLAALGYWEGARYAAYVDEYKCQDPVWRASPEGQKLMHLGGDCDHKLARSLFQIHPIEDKESPLYALCNAAAIESGRLPAARCALELAGRSMKSTGNLSNYTGEFWGEHPKADQRSDFAKTALSKHPFMAVDRKGDGE